MLKFVFQLIWAPLILWALHLGPGGIAPVGHLIDPLRGLYHNARIAEHSVEQSDVLSGLDSPVTIERDERGVPHIFAESDKDAVIALGYATAQDRLFQMDFISRVAAGRMSEMFGPGSVETDRYLRGTGMNWAAKQILQAHIEEQSLDYQTSSWFAQGANSFINDLSYAQWPIEFKLFNLAPEPYSPLKSILLVQYFDYDLSFGNQAPAYARALNRLSADEYAELYPRHDSRYVPIIPPQNTVTQNAIDSVASHHSVASNDVISLIDRMYDTLRDSGIEGYRPSKGSNNWAVAGNRSATGAPILAGDMHLALTLPSIWYEVHMVTPSMNTYGVVSPGTPVPIEAFNDHVAWAYTNSHIDGIDYYQLKLSQDKKSYRFNGYGRLLQLLPDTIFIKGEEPVIDTLRISHFGPVIMGSESALAIKWVAHNKNYMLKALWDMNHAQNAAEIDSALMNWNSPSQNVLYADTEGTIGIRVAGTIPIRASGHGIGILDGSTIATKWTGKIPFEELPHAINPDQGFLTSTNQQPTTADYPYYLNHDWPAAYRSLRIHELLTNKSLHTFEDITRYQGDIYVGQFDAFVPILPSGETLSPDAKRVRDILSSWDGYATLDSQSPLALHEYLIALKQLTWDEEVFRGLPTPSETILLQFLEHGSKWLDVQETSEIEDADMLMTMALEQAAITLSDEYEEDWTWGRHHQVIFRHLTQTEALDMLWRGPYEYPGFDDTLGPADGLLVTHSASWRVGVEFSQKYPVGKGIYAGGQSGNPMSKYYDLHMDDYISYNLYPLHKPRSAGELDSVSSTLNLLTQ